MKLLPMIEVISFTFRTLVPSHCIEKGFFWLGVLSIGPGAGIFDEIKIKKRDCSEDGQGPQVIKGVKVFVLLIFL